MSRRRSFSLGPASPETIEAVRRALSITPEEAGRLNKALGQFSGTAKPRSMYCADLGKGVIVTVASFGEEPEK